ncbi:MAG: hypothetical protein K5989_08895, partial [Lachnospiraceae bacterium]|nr:hypothetical protein [Lachnospiraceae bacterium]
MEEKKQERQVKAMEANRERQVKKLKPQSESVADNGDIYPEQTHVYAYKKGKLLEGNDQRYVVINPMNYGGQAEVYIVGDERTYSYCIAKIYLKGIRNKYHDKLVPFLKNHKEKGIIHMLDDG